MECVGVNEGCRVARNGDVYFSDNNDSYPTGASTIYKLSGTKAQVVFTLPAIASDFALDANGNFYLASSTDNRIYRYSAFGAPQAFGARGTTGLDRIQDFVKGYRSGLSAC